MLVPLAEALDHLAVDPEAKHIRGDDVVLDDRPRLGVEHTHSGATASSAAHPRLLLQGVAVDHHGLLHAAGWLAGGDQ